MWRKPPKAVEESFRAMVVLAMIFMGFTALRLVAFGLPMSFRRWTLYVTTITQFFAIAVPVWNPKHRIERLCAQTVARRIAAKRKFIVRLRLLKGKDGYGQDVGVLTLEDGCLIFQGLSTSFSIPRSQIGRRKAVVGEDLGGIKLLTHVGEEAIGINLAEEGKRATDPSLDEALDQFWRTASSGELIPPPVTPQPSLWPGWTFPGWRQVAFWGATYLFLIVQAEVLQAQGSAEAQGNLTLAAFGTLGTALALEVFRTVRLFRETSRMLPSEFRSILANAPAHAADEPAEARLRA